MIWFKIWAFLFCFSLGYWNVQTGNVPAIVICFFGAACWAFGLGLDAGKAALLRDARRASAGNRIQ